MSVLSIKYTGRALTHQKVTPGNTITALSAYCYKYCVYRLNFDAGTDAIVAGDWVVGATSGAVGMVRYIEIATGSWVGDDAVGYMLIDSWNGTAWTNNEKIKVAADATCGDVNQAAAIVEASDAEYLLAGTAEFRGRVARHALVVCYANTLLCSISRGKPDQTALIGLPMVAGASIELTDANQIANFKCIDYTAASAGIAQVDFSF